MTVDNLSDRRQYTQALLDEMTGQTGAEHPGALRRIAAGTLGFTTVRDAVIATENEQLPTVATIVAEMPNEFGPDYLAVHFDLSAREGAPIRPYVTNAQVQAANGVAQRYAGEERYPLLTFTLPDSSGVQFVTGSPEPGNHHRLRDVVRVTAHRSGRNRTTLECLERVGSAIVRGDAPQRAFRTGHAKLNPPYVVPLDPRSQSCQNPLGNYVSAKTQSDSQERIQ